MSPACAGVQDDVLYESLTVHETLTFSGLLRLPRTMTRAEKVSGAHEQHTRWMMHWDDCHGALQHGGTCTAVSFELDEGR